MTDVRAARVRIAADHPSLDGHFPGHPVVPGVVLLAEALAAVEAGTGRAADAWTLVKAKFLRVVQPECELEVRHAPTPTGGVRFEIRSGGGLVATGELEPR